MTNHRIRLRATLVLALMSMMTIASGRLAADTGTCGGASTTLPFVDVPAANPFFCSIAEALFSGLSNGTDATHYSPAANVSREQMAAFVTRTMDQSLKRGSRRTKLQQAWTPTSSDSLGLTTVGTNPELATSDGADVWVANMGDGTVSRVRASDGKLLGTWTGATSAFAPLSAKGFIYVTGRTNPGKIYLIDPTAAPGAVTTVTSALGVLPTAIAFDGSRIWTANSNSVSIVALNPVSVTTVTTGFTSPQGILFDGSNIWVTDSQTPGKLFKLDANGAIIQTVDVGNAASLPVFDGTNIWVPSVTGNSVTVVRASTGTVLATLTGNGLSGPLAAAFDGERIMVTNNGAQSVSLWKAADLTSIGTVGTGASTMPTGVCSDGLNFWIVLQLTGKLARF